MTGIEVIHADYPMSTLKQRGYQVGAKKPRAPGDQYLLFPVVLSHAIHSI
jgi:hypothetical protein